MPGSRASAGPAPAGLEVILADGDPVPAATVVLGIGAAPAVGWLAGSGLDLGDGGAEAIRCDEHGATNLAGRVRRRRLRRLARRPDCGHHYQIEHWTSAKERGAVVAARLLGAERSRPAGAPYVWSDLYGKKLQLAGYRDLADHPDTLEHTLEAGSLAEGSFTAVYRRGGEPVAVLALDQSRQFDHNPPSSRDPGPRRRRRSIQHDPDRSSPAARSRRSSSTPATPSPTA